MFGGFAPNSESAQVLSKALGSRTVQSGSVNRGKNDPSQSLQMIERALMTPDELKSLPKGTFVVMKTGFHPMQVKLKLFFKWGIVFPKDFYVVEDKDNRKVTYANQAQFEGAIVQQYATASVGEKMTEEEIEQHHPPIITAVPGKTAFQQNKKPATAKGDKDPDDIGDGADSQPMSESNFSSLKEEKEILVNEKGEIVGEKLRERV